MKSDIALLEQRLNYSFKHKSLLLKALTHRSMRVDHNERLEFLGDSILNFTIANALYQQLPYAKEGDLSRYRAQLVCEESLATRALAFDVGSFLILGTGELRSGGFRRKSIVADALEAIIAAIYLDSDIITCQNLVQMWFQEQLHLVAQAKLKKDPKSMLQEYLQSKQRALPFYKVLKISGADHEQVFHVACCVEGFSEEVVGQGDSRRIAEQKAATIFLEKILKQGKK